MMTSDCGAVMFWVSLFFKNHRCLSVYSVYLLAQIRPAEETAVRLKFRSCDQSISPWIECP